MFSQIGLSGPDDQKMIHARQDFRSQLPTCSIGDAPSIQHKINDLYYKARRRIVPIPARRLTLKYFESQFFTVLTIQFSFLRQSFSELLSHNNDSTDLLRQYLKSSTKNCNSLMTPFLELQTTSTLQTYSHFPLKQPVDHHNTSKSAFIQFFFSFRILRFLNSISSRGDVHLVSRSGHCESLHSRKDSWFRKLFSRKACHRQSHGSPVRVQGDPLPPPIATECGSF